MASWQYIATLQSLTEGLPSTVKPSFVDMVHRTSDQTVKAMKEASSYKGVPELNFLDSEVL